MLTEEELLTTYRGILSHFPEKSLASIIGNNIERTGEKIKSFSLMMVSCVLYKGSLMRVNSKLKKKTHIRSCTWK